MKSQTFTFFLQVLQKLKINKMKDNDQHFIPSGEIVTGDNP
jgi:hypothetical protein